MTSLCILNDVYIDMMDYKYFDSQITVCNGLIHPHWTALNTRCNTVLSMSNGKLKHFHSHLWGDMAVHDKYRQVSNIRHTKSQHLKDSRTVLGLSSLNPLKPDVK